MTTQKYILKNSKDQIVRTISSSSTNIIAVRLKDTQRLEFKTSTTELEAQNIEFSILKEFTNKSITKSGVQIAEDLFVFTDDSNGATVADVSLPAEDKNLFPLVLKRTAGGHAAVLALILISALIMNKFFNKAEDELPLVTVFQQERPQPKTTVNMSKKKIKKTQTKARVANKTTTRTSQVTSSRVQKSVPTKRPATQLKDQGALAVLGGMGKNMNGSGGTNLRANSNNPGVGSGGPAARGGAERGLLGKGLVNSGVGSGGNLKGYNGYGTSGKGGGKPGYGSMRMAGSSGSYMMPLSEESLIEGGLDSDQINSVIQRNLGQVIYCYEQGLQTKPSLAGRVAVRFVISANGLVDTARVANTSLSSSQVESCIVQKLRGWKFPKPTGSVSVRVTYPFILKRLSSG